MLNLKHVAVLTFEGVPAYEFSCALELFALSRPEIENAYTCEALAVDGRVVKSTGGVTIGVNRAIDALEEFGTIIVPGWPLERRDIPDKLKQGLLDVHTHGGRLISICSGAFLLAEIGLLEGKRATTHWRYSDQFKQRYPGIWHQDNVIYTQDGNIFTSAGSSAGLDLCLEIVRQDLGFRLANKVARRLVMPPHRTGGQAQYIEQAIIKSHHKLNDALDWAQANMQSEIRIDQLAEKACISRRSFDRQFRKAMSMSPKHWLTQIRIQRACELLESTTLNIDYVAEKSGFDKAINLRHHFKVHKGILPSQYRNQFSAKIISIETA